MRVYVATIAVLVAALLRFGLSAEPPLAELAIIKGDGPGVTNGFFCLVVGSG